MQYSPAIAQETVDLAAGLLTSEPTGFLVALQALDAPIYVTDANGVIVFFNVACVGFAGRTPATGKDRWCVSWKLYTEAGDFLPHDQCPMAQAIRDQTPIRGVKALAERPDGTRVNFMPLPTPIFGADGTFLGAVNILLDVTDLRQIDELRSQADRCRRLARAIGDERTVNTLEGMAADYDTTATALQRARGLAAANGPSFLPMHLAS
jgi:hypothetical protein